jgi:hypothetical protein
VLVPPPQVCTPVRSQAPSASRRRWRPSQRILQARRCLVVAAVVRDDCRRNTAEEAPAPVGIPVEEPVHHTVHPFWDVSGSATTISIK